MIKIRTVLVFGAGTSAPFGFPTGIGLCQEIIAELKDEQQNSVKQLQNAGHSFNDILQFREALLYSAKESVDAFLEHRTDYLQVGKAAIAQALIKRELLPPLFENIGNNLYSYLYAQLNAPVADFPGNQLSIITFNYDRSFEQFLFTALKNSFNLSDVEAAKLVAAVPIIHLHGAMGCFPWQGTRGREYGSDTTPINIKIASQGIKIIHEAVNLDKDPEFQRAYGLIRQAKRLVFLGFGYNRTNLDRLRIDFSVLNTNFYGSCFGLTELEKEQLWIECSRRISFGGPAENALTFLRNHVVLSA